MKVTLVVDKLRDVNAFHATRLYTFENIMKVPSD